MGSWDKSKPASGGGFVSADHRANWAALAASIARNWSANDDFRLWSAGDTSAPDYYSLTGAGAAIARAGTGLGDTNRKMGDFCAKVTAGGGAAATLQQRLLASSGTVTRSGMAGMDFGFGVWVKTSTATSCRIGCYDGVGTSFSGYHTGGGAWEWLSGYRSVDASATELTLRVSGVASSVFYVSALTGLHGTVAPDYWQPCQIEVISIDFPPYVTGNCSTGTAIGGRRIPMTRPAIVRETMLICGTAPATQAIIVDINKNGTTMYSTRPQIAAAATTGSASPDSATYSTRCLARGDYLTMDVDQVGTGTTGADLTAQVRAHVYVRPQDGLVAVGEIA